MEINPRQERFYGTNSRYQAEAPSSNDHKCLIALSTDDL